MEQELIKVKQIVAHQYNNITLQFTENAYVNITPVCKNFGKLKLQKTQ